MSHHCRGLHCTPSCLRPKSLIESSQALPNTGSDHDVTLPVSFPRRRCRPLSLAVQFPAEHCHGVRQRNHQNGRQPTRQHNGHNSKHPWKPLLPLLLPTSSDSSTTQPAPSGARDMRATPAILTGPSITAPYYAAELHRLCHNTEPCRVTRRPRRPRSSVSARPT